MQHRSLTWMVTLSLLAAPPLLAQAKNPSVDPKGRFAVFMADKDTDGVRELCSSDLKSGQVRKLNGLIVPGGRVESFAVDPKGRYAVYFADQDNDDVLELFRSDLKTAEVRRLNGPLVTNGFISAPQVTVGPKGRHVVYVAEQDTDDVRELYRSKLTNGTDLKLSGELVGGGDVFID